MKATICSAESILSKQNLRIAPYQRPYRWTEKNITQLLKDIHESQLSNKSKYRIGSIIFYSNTDKRVLEIVDGQQRITSILLVLRYIYDKRDKDSLKNLKLLNELKFNHSESQENIINNTKVIGQWLNDNKVDLISFAKYLRVNCEFVEICVDNLSEAFQMFDSQNGRGKELEPYNLLKAYHIRAMEKDSSNTKIYCDKRWENATLFRNQNEIIDLLKQLFNEQLYRTRLWSRKETAFTFTKKKLDEFKGFTLNKDNKVEYPYQNLLYYLAIKKYYKNCSNAIKIKNRLKTNNDKNLNPFFNINQEIINGKIFFDYVETYIEMYKILFIDTSYLKEFKDFFKRNCLYENYTRVGDTYLRELYKSLIFILFDRFGEDGVLKFHKIFYRWVYKARLEKGKIYKESVAQMPNQTEQSLNPFFLIANAKNLSDLYAINKNIVVQEENFTNLPKEVIAEIRGE